jgi:methionyl-tRNA formyltransferase
MRVVVFTQNETLFLAQAIDIFCRRLPSHIELVGAIVLDPSPFGGKKSFFRKAYETLKIFGVMFLLKYGLTDLWNRVFSDDVLKVFNKHHIPIIKIQGSINSKESLSKVEYLLPDLCVSITANQIFKKQLLDIPKKGTLNLHTALLPKYRGLMPTFWALKNDESETGVSVFLMDEGIDSGPIVVQKRIRLKGLTLWEAVRMTKFIGMEAIIEAIIKIDLGNVDFIENDKAASSYFSFPTRNDVTEFRQSGKKFF